MPDIEDSLRRYADALERSASMPAPTPRRRRGIVLALVAAIGVLAIAATAVVITRDDDTPSHVRTVDSSSTTAPTALDPTRCIPGPEEPVDFEIFLAPEATAEQVAAVRAVLTAPPGVDWFSYLSHAGAYQEFTRRFGRDQPDLVKTVSPADLPESFRVKASALQAQQVLSKVRNLPGVQSVDGPSNVTCPTTTTATAPSDPNVWVTAKIHLDKTTFAPGEDVTGEVVFTNHLPTDAVLTTDQGCLTGWVAAVARGNARITAVSTRECRRVLSIIPNDAWGRSAFRPGTTTVPFAVPSTYWECTSKVPQPGTPKCIRGHMPPLPPGPARVGIATGSSNAQFSVPAPRRITLKPLGSRLPFCAARQLAAHEKNVRTTRQQPRALFVVKNTSQHTCQLDGYPSVALHSTDGGYIQVNIDHGSHLLFSAVRPRPVPLRPGAEASFDLGYSTLEPGNASSTCTRQAETIRIVLPDSGGRMKKTSTTVAPCVIRSADSIDAANLTISPFLSGRTGVHR